MKKHYFKNVIAVVISMIMLFSDITVFAANNEETIGEINYEQNLEYSTYWDNPNFSNLVVFVEMSEVRNYEDISEIKEGLDEVRDHFYSVSEGELMIENIVPQYDINNDEMPLLVLENSYEYYIEDEAKLVDEVVQYLNESAIISDTINLHYSSDEEVLDNLTIIALGESVNEVLVSHAGTYEGQANVKEHSIHDYILLAEQDLVDLEQGNALEIMSEVLGFTNLEDLSKQIEEEISTTTEIMYGDTEEKNSDIKSFSNTGWYQTDGNWYYTQEDGNDAVGITEIEGKKYYFDDAGCLKSGWQKIDDIRYFFAVEEKPQDCCLLCEVQPQSGWVEMTNGDKCYAGEGGSVVAGWQIIEEQKYYFDSYGILQTGWIEFDNTWYYANENGKITEGLTEIEGKIYHFDSVNGLTKGWVRIGAIRYFFSVEEIPQDCYLQCEVQPQAGWVQMVNGEKCYAREGGSVVAGWYTIEGQKYYFDSYGIMQTGWFTVENVLYYGDEATGIVASGLKKIDGKTYGFHESENYLLTGISTINGKKYCFDTDGLLQTGWINAGSNWYYTDASGEPAEGLTEIEGKKYYFDSETGLKKGWVKLGTIRYFFAVEETPQECYLVCEVLPQSGWVEMTNGDKCYAGVGGSVVAGIQTIGGQKFYFDSYGIMQTGWIKVESNWYYADANGKVAEGLTEIGGQKYYFDSETGLKKGWVKLGTIRYFFAVEETPQECYLICEVLPKSGWVEMTNGEKCYAREGGSVVAGWYTIEGEKYYFDSYGIMQKGWLTLGNAHYYGDETTGIIASGLKEINGKTYGFHESENYLLTGISTINGKKYCFDTDGLLQTGWINAGSNWYYTDASGEPAEGLTEIEGKKYYFDNETGLKKGWVKLGTIRYFFAVEATPQECYLVCEVMPQSGWVEMTNGDKCYAREGGSVVAGWYTIEGEKYYFDSYGIMQTGWIKVESNWYYADANGKVAEGLTEIDGQKYYFDNETGLKKGWVKLGTIRYFFAVEPTPQRCYQLCEVLPQAGWVEMSNGAKCYAREGGSVVAGWYTIDGYQYYFDSYGIMQTGWQTINGSKCFFNIDGIYISTTVPVINSVTNEKYRCIDVKWNRVAGVKKYILEYSIDSNFKNVVSITFEGDSITEYQLEDVDGGQKYYFRLKYTVLTGTKEKPEEIQSQYSIVKTFTVRGEVAPTANSAVISECKISSGSKESGMKVHLKAELKDHIKSADNKYYIVECESYGNAIEILIPEGDIDKVLEPDITIQITDVNRALMNKFALAILKNDGTYQLISEPVGITNPEAVAENTTPILKPTSKKGLQGIGHTGALDTNSKNTLFNLDLASVVGNGPAAGYVAYEYKGRTYYFSNCSDLVAEFKELDEGIIQYAQGITGKKNKVCVTLNLLLSYKASNAYLIDPAARTPGHNYYTLNMREERARETLEAVFLYLGELFGQHDCYVTHWVLGNEVNSSKAWNYQGSLSFAAYMQSYATAFRLLYNGVKAAKTGNNVYISLDNGWTAAPDTYAGKTTLDTFASYAQKENPHMRWSIAYHGYSYPLTRVDFWNDSSNTVFSTSTKYISMKNISVLTDYAAALERTYNKPSGSIRVIFSEQGYTAGGRYDVEAKSQAQALARGYYMAEFNNRVDAFIIRALSDDSEEMKGNLYFGLKTNGSLDKYADTKRITFYTYEYMDSNIDKFANVAPSMIALSSENQKKVREAQRILSNTNWSSIIPGFSKSKLAGMY